MPPNFPSHLETERLSLRPFIDDDLEGLARILTDPETSRFLIRQPKDVEETWPILATMVGHWGLRGYGPMAVIERESGELVGRAGLWRPHGWPAIEVIWTVDRTRWGRGYATEAASAVLAAAREGFGANALCSLIAPENKASVRVAEKLGGRREETTSLFYSRLSLVFRYPA